MATTFKKNHARRKVEREGEQELEQTIIDIARVSRVMAGGKRMSFRACVVVGDRKGKVGMAMRKGADVSLAVKKASSAAAKRMIHVTIFNETIPHVVRVKFGAAEVLLKPAPRGTGVIAGGPVRAVLTIAGVKNVVAKMLGSKNKVNNVMATLNALETLRNQQSIEQFRGVVRTQEKK